MVTVGFLRLATGFERSLTPSRLAWSLVLIPCVCVVLALIAWSLFLGDRWDEETFVDRPASIVDAWPWS